VGSFVPALHTLLFLLLLVLFPAVGPKLSSLMVQGR
jgi:hypothetical protein